MPAEKSPAARAHSLLDKVGAHNRHPLSLRGRPCDACEDAKEAHAALDEAVREAEQKTVNAHHAWVRETFGWGACEWRKDAIEEARGAGPVALSKGARGMRLTEKVAKVLCDSACLAATEHV